MVSLRIPLPQRWVLFEYTSFDQFPNWNSMGHKGIFVFVITNTKISLSSMHFDLSPYCNETI